MKTITICQPYAELILLGEKRVENRVWRTDYRGPLLIHAGKSRTWLDSYEPLPVHMDFGGLVGICELAACFPARSIRARKVPQKYWDLADDMHVEGPYCWILDRVHRFPAMLELAGRQGLFDIDAGKIAATIKVMLETGAMDKETAEYFLKEAA
jgi:hypothetical protein